MEVKTLSISHFDDETLFSLWTDEGLRQVCAESKYVHNAINRHSFHAPPFNKSGKVFLRFAQVAWPVPGTEYNQQIFFICIPLHSSIHKRDYNRDNGTKLL